MTYFVLSTACFSGFGYQHLFLALGIYPDDWPYLLPPWVFVLVYLLSSALCFAVAIMLSFHLLGISRAETSVESHDFPMYHAKARERGSTFVNCFDLGKRRNFELFFNVGPPGEYSYSTLIFPLRISPYTNGRAWARSPGLTGHLGMEPSDEYTDDEEDYPHLSAP
jgi:palmitoyltransferase